MALIQRFLEDHALFRSHLGQALQMAVILAPGSPVPTLNAPERTFSLRLRRHARMEGELLFPALQRSGGDRLRQHTIERYISHGNEEHQFVAKRMAQWLAATDVQSWCRGLEIFAEGLRRHIEMEELELFPLAQLVLSEETLVKLNEKADQIQ